MPPRAARLDPRDAYCSRNPPPPHHPYHAMRRAARAAAPPSASHRLPTPARRYSRCHRGSRETRPLLPIPHPCPARPPSLSSGKRATRSRLLANRRPAPVRAPRTRESVPAASSRRSRRDVLPVGAALLSPAPSLIQHAQTSLVPFYQSGPLISFYLCRRAGWRGLRGWVGGRPSGGDCATDPIMGDSPEIFSYPHVPPCTPIYPSFPQTSPCHF